MDRHPRHRAIGMTGGQTGSTQVAAVRTGQQASQQVQKQEPYVEHGIMGKSAAADGQRSAVVIAQSEISQPHSALQSGCCATNCFCMSYAQYI